MSRIQPLDVATATGKAAELFEASKKKLGVVPNMFRTMANSPAVLEAYFGFSGALAHGSLSGKIREQIALVVGQENACGYCVSAHTVLGKGAGLSDADALSARKGQATDPKTAAILTLARKINAERGHASDADLSAARAAGVTDGEIGEVVANVALNIFTNYFNHVADPVIDFPQVTLKL